MGTNRRAVTLRRYGREISFVLIVKAAGIYLLWVLFFSSVHQVRPTPASTAGRIFGDPPITTPGVSRHE